MEDDISFAPIQQSMSIVVEDDAVARLGYKPELKRSFGAFGMLGFAFSIVTCWTALSGVLIVGVTSGGPPVIIWSWLGICTFSLAVAYSMAEMCSAYPVAGGQYSWTAILAPPKMARAFSYLNGWFMIIGIVATGAVNNFITANYLLGMANLNYPDFVIERWHTTLCAYAVGAFALFVNVGIPAVLDKMSLSLLIWNIGAFLTIIVVVLAMNDNKRSADFVFKDFVNLTGWNRSYTTIIGLLQTAWGMCCYDAPAHMTEGKHHSISSYFEVSGVLNPAEIKHARKQAPRAIILSVWMGAFTGFIFLIVICFSIGDIDATATSSTGVPLIQIFHDSTGSNIAATILTVLITVISFGASNSLTAEAGRSIYAFARDEGLPFSGIWKMIEKRRQIPVYALCLTCLVQAAFVSIYFVSCDVTNCCGALESMCADVL